MFLKQSIPYKYQPLFFIDRIIIFNEKENYPFTSKELLVIISDVNNFWCDKEVEQHVVWINAFKEYIDNFIE
jgi:hypothetical protein